MKQCVMTILLRESKNVEEEKEDIGILALFKYPANNAETFHICSLMK